METTDTAQHARTIVELMKLRDEVVHGVELFTRHAPHGAHYDPALLQEAAEGIETSLRELNSAEEQLLRSQAALEAERRQYRDLFDLIPDACLVTDAYGRIDDVNHAASALFNVPQHKLDRTLIATWVDPKDRPAFRRWLGGVTASDRLTWAGRLRPRELQPITAEARVFVVRGPRRRILSLRWIIRDITDQKRADVEIEQHRAALRSLASELTLAEERERRRVAVQIHDGMAQTLVMLKLKLAALKATTDGSLRAELEQSVGLLEDAIRQARTLTHELSPPVLHEFGLEAALQWLAQQKSNSLTTFQFHADDAAKPLTRDAQVLIFQAVRELMMNVIKHADAVQCVISTARTGDTLYITVADDGKGFDVEQALRHQPDGDLRGFGLFSVRERLHHLGGSIRIDSRPGSREGTRVTLTVPLIGDNSHDRNAHDHL